MTSMMNTEVTTRTAEINGCPGYLLTEEGKVWNPWVNAYTLPYYCDSSNCRIVEMRIQGVKKRFKLHNLLAAAFIPNPEGYKFVGFKDGNGENNSLDNLQWLPARRYCRGNMTRSLTPDKKSKAERFYAKDKLKNRGLFERYRLNSTRIRQELIQQYDATGVVQEDICEIVIETNLKQEVDMLYAYYPNLLRSIKYITDEVVVTLLTKYQETIDLIQENRKKSGSIRTNMAERAKLRSQEKGLPFAITAEDILLPRICPYLKTPLEYGNLKATKHSPSLDRIIPSLGYVKGNIQVISLLANQMKSYASPEEILMFASSAISFTSA